MVNHLVKRLAVTVLTMLVAGETFIDTSTAEMNDREEPNCSDGTASFAERGLVR